MTTCAQNERFMAKTGLKSDQNSLKIAGNVKV